jgi:hypothetical protein
MTDTNVPDGRRAGATWVAATGAFLLVAAAAVFIAVRWDTLPEAAKLGLVGALTGGFLVGGRSLKRTLPSTGDVLFHLGAFLLPVDVAGLAVRAHAGWRGLLLAEGVVGVAAIGALAAGTGSVVLASTAGLAMVVLALGVAAVTALPAPLLLAGAAVAATAAGRRRAAVVWAAVAGLAPVLAVGAARLLALAAGRRIGAGTLGELGLAGSSAALLAGVSGALAAGVLAREAGRTKDLALAALSALSLVAGVGTSWVASSPSATSWMLALPSVFVVVEVLAMVSERDEFWRRPARALGLATEALALLSVPVAAGTILLAPLVDEGVDLFSDSPGWAPQPAMAAAWLLAGAAWSLASWRRRSPQPTLTQAALAAATDDRAVALLATAVAAAAVVGPMDTRAAAVALLALGTALLGARRVMATIAGVALVGWAPVVLAVTHPTEVLPVGLGAAAALVVVGARRWQGATAGVLTLLASVVVVATASHTAAAHGPTLGLLVLVFAGWVLAAAIGDVDEASGWIARSTMVLGALGSLGAADRQALPVALSACFLLAIDAVRTDDPRLGFAAAGLLPFAVLPATGLAGLPIADAGLVLAMTAVVAAGLAVLTPSRWRPPVLVAAGWTLAVGLALTTVDPVRFGEALLVGGGLTIGAGVALRWSWVGHAGGAVATVGLGVLLSHSGVVAVEPYLAPVALQLAVLGWQARRRPATDGAERISSWVAYGPALGLVAVPALTARWDGGPAWHALVAGAVGVVGVAVGGWKRLAGPLFLGTGLLVLVTFGESLHALAGVPTWGWLAAGGSVLLATGVALERTATSPVDAGRRLVDEVSDRFD